MIANRRVRLHLCQPFIVFRANHTLPPAMIDETSILTTLVQPAAQRLGESVLSRMTYQGGLRMENGGSKTAILHPRFSTYYGLSLFTSAWLTVFCIGAVSIHSAFHVTQ